MKEALTIAAALFCYFLPSICAANHKNGRAIFVTNLLFGWTLIGWGVALIWAAKK